MASVRINCDTNSDAAVHDKPENKNPFDTAEKYARIGDKEKKLSPGCKKAYAALKLI